MVMAEAGRILGDAFARAKDWEGKMLFWHMANPALICPQCSRQYLRVVWFYRHMYKKKHWPDFA